MIPYHWKQHKSWDPWLTQVRKVMTSERAATERTRRRKSLWMVVRNGQAMLFL